MAALVSVFKKIKKRNKTKCDTFYSNSKAEIIINKSDIDDVFQSIYTTNISKHTQIFRKRFGLDYLFRQ